MWPDRPRHLATVSKLAILLTLTSLPTPRAASESTCVARTVNYITHGLPQQCLTSFSAYPATTSEPTAPTDTYDQAVTATADPSSAPNPDGANEDDDDNDLSTGTFMSFDEWKAMMVAKAEEQPKKRRVPEGRGEASKGDFASLGDEGEIDLDFDAYSDRISDFTASSSSSSFKQGEPEEKQENKLEKVTHEEGLAMVHRSKDAGKTCKERFSYSSFDAGATVIKTSKPIKNPSAILLENKDAYMLLECATENKFFIVELSDDILVDTVVLANYEFFSSMIREFRVSISDRYPVKADKWKVLGTFQARNARDIQPFLIEHPQDWARYLRVEILNHWGNEFYCPVSLLRVHGTRMMEAFKEPEALDDDVDDEPPKPLAIEDAKAQEHVETSEEQIPEEPVEVVELEPETPPEPSPPVASPEPIKSKQTDEMASSKNPFYLHLFDSTTSCPTADQTVTDSHNQPRSQTSEITSSSAGEDALEQITQGSSSGFTTQSSASATSVAHNVSATVPTTSVADPSIRRITVHTMIHNNTTPRSSEQPTIASTTTGQPVPPRPTESAETVTSPQQYPPKSQPVDHGSSKVANSQQQSAKSSTTAASSTVRSKGSSTTGAAAASPTVQDSFFKALTKRLQILESNTTLSLQYIESQSKFIQEALAKLEKRQISRVDKFLNTLNNTVLNELRDVRREVHQIWQSTVIALETQREQVQQENLALGSRVSILADEVVFQKRMAIVQSILLLICLVLVIFSRGFQGGAAGVISADCSYSGQFFAATSRLGSPAYPMTPKSAYRDTPARDRGSDLAAPRDSTPRPANNRADTLQEQQHGQASLRVPPTLSRSASATAAELQEYYNQQLPTPGGSVHHGEADEGEEELGYDSEPNMTPSRRGNFAGKNADYFFSAANSVVDDAEQDARNGGLDAIGPGSVSGSGPGSGFGSIPERQHTPTSEEMPDEDYTPRQPLGRIGLMHTGSTRKPLPALPEDPD